jgi:hypothetical protein
MKAELLKLHLDDIAGWTVKLEDGALALVDCNTHDVILIRVTGQTCRIETHPTDDVFDWLESSGWYVDWSDEIGSTNCYTLTPSCEHDEVMFRLRWSL